MKINREELYKLYMEQIDDICETCDWKTHFKPDEIVNIIASILETNPELIKMLPHIYKFYKTEENRWYIDLPGWTGTQAELEMVAGADDMLNILSNNGDKINLEIETDSSLSEIFSNKLELLQKHPQILGGGADYKWGDKKIWLCDVTKFVFGNFPKTIYFNII